MVKREETRRAGVGRKEVEPEGWASHRATPADTRERTDTETALAAVARLETRDNNAPEVSAFFGEHTLRRRRRRLNISTPRRAEDAREDERGAEGASRRGGRRVRDARSKEISKALRDTLQGQVARTLSKLKRDTFVEKFLRLARRRVASRKRAANTRYALEFLFLSARSSASRRQSRNFTVARFPNGGFLLQVNGQGNPRNRDREGSWGAF